jgi:hypothetical protein
MAYGFLQTVDAFNGAAGTALGVSITHAANSSAFVYVNYESDTATATVADTLSNSYTQVGTYLTESGVRRSALFFGNIATGGATTVTVTVSASSATREISVTTYSGLAAAVQSGATATNNQTAPGTGADAVTTGLMTPTAQPAIVFGVCRDLTGTSAVSAGTGFTSRGTLAAQDSGDGETSRIEDLRITATSNVAATFTAGTAGDHFYTLGAIVSEFVVPIMMGQACL